MSYSRPLIYLSGSMESKDDLGAEWRTRIITLAKTYGLPSSDYKFYNPCDEELPISDEIFPDKRTFLNSKVQNEELNPNFKSVMDAIVEHDIRALYDKSAAVILMYEGIMSWGSAGEITLAKMLGIPVVTINTCEDLNAVPGWIIGCSDVIVNNMHAALEEVIKRIEWAKLKTTRHAY